MLIQELVAISETAGGATLRQIVDALEEHGWQTNFHDGKVDANSATISFHDMDCVGEAKLSLENDKLVVEVKLHHGDKTDGHTYYIPLNSFKSLRDLAEHIDELAGLHTCTLRAQHVDEGVIVEKTGALDLTAISLADALETLETRLAASRRGLTLAHKLKDPVQKKKHFSLILTNMNVVRNQLNKVINRLGAKV